MQLRVHAHGVVDSTSERAFAALAAGTARHGDVHVADGQTAGRGRRGRAWHSPPGAGVYASLVLLPPPPGPPPAALTLAGGLAVLDAARALGVQGARLEWPNDLVVGGAKLAGVLVESRGFDPSAPHFVLGIGLNVAERAFPPELEAEREVTSLARLGLDATVPAAEAALLAALPARVAQALAGDPRLAADFTAALGLLGRPVAARVGSAVHAGRLAGLDPAGALRLETPAGTLALPLAHVTGLEPAAGPG